MHYRAARIGWLEPLDDMAGRFARVTRADGPTVELDAVHDIGSPILLVPGVP